mgnify:CR=1 FL=1
MRKITFPILLLIIAGVYLSVSYYFHSPPFSTSGLSVLKSLPQEPQKIFKEALKEPYSTPFIPAHLLLNLQDVENIVGAWYEEEQSITSKGEGEKYGFIERHQEEFTNKNYMDYALGLSKTKPTEIKPLFITSFLIVYSDKEKARSEFLNYKNDSEKSYKVEKEQKIDIDDDLEAYQINFLNSNGARIIQIEYIKDNIIVRLTLIGEKYFENEALEFGKIMGQKWKTLEYF